MKASDYIAEFFASKNIDKVFGYIGGMITHLADSLALSDKVEFVSTIHEQGAAFAAEGYARVCGKTAVAMATSGPGATNLLTGVGSCFFDSVPVMFITGQVNTYDYKGSLPIRQRGFQETDIVAMARPITKYAVRISRADDLKYELQKAYHIANSGRKGPVLIDIPMDIQRAQCNFAKLRSFKAPRQRYAKNLDLRIKKIAAIIKEAKRPAMLLGAGVSYEAIDLAKSFAEKNSIATVLSLNGRDRMAKSPLNMGLVGVYGTRYANFTVANSDVLLVVGSRLDSRQTGNNHKLFARNAKIVRVDIDKDEAKHSNMKANTTLITSSLEFFKRIAKLDCNENRNEWLKYLANCKKAFPIDFAYKNTPKYENIFVRKVSQTAKNAKCICADVGQNQIWTAQSYENLKGQRMLFSGGMGAMGFALPAAIGAAMATKKQCVVFCGDGGFQMNIQELEVVKRRNLPIKIFVFDNKCLGMVRQFQEMYFQGRRTGTVDDYSSPDFCRIAKAYKIKSVRINVKKPSQKVLDKIFADNNPVVVVVVDGQDSNIEPKLTLQHPLEDMTKYLPRKEFLKFMLVKPAKESLENE
ncbi:MAG: thiamine pyrophosphate-binding protein [Opitutales bacterium]|nr:thiamine pyrophosphate-binding protein [Opitutales bacterium]